jgi:16S rRNA (adenine1518-N6/adenine1519-N6)-dimethyltransferase
MFSENDLIDAGIDPQARPETVPVEQFVALANRLP